MTDKQASELVPAATVILIRDGALGLETLMLRRNSRLEFVGGMWVFPGGRVDPEDRAGLAGDDVLGAARRAAVREAHEEAGLTIDAKSLVTLSRWTPPANVGLAKRFETWIAEEDASAVSAISPGEWDAVTIVVKKG